MNHSTHIHYNNSENLQNINDSLLLAVRYIYTRHNEPEVRQDYLIIFRIFVSSLKKALTREKKKTDAANIVNKIAKC